MLLFFADNTVLVNFALIDEMALLERLLHGQGRWCATVAQECAESAHRAPLPPLLSAPSIFGDPLRPTPTELLDTRLLRDRMASPHDPPRRHLGEAETIAILARRGLEALFVTDDREAARLAAAEGVATVTTWDLLRVAVRTGLLGVDECSTCAAILQSHHRSPPPCGYDRAALSAWLRPAPSSGHAPRQE